MAVINTRMAARAVKLLVESQTDPVNSRARTYARETIGHTTSLSTAINVLVRLPTLPSLSFLWHPHSVAR